MLQDHVNKIEIMRCEVLAWLCYLKAIHGALSWLLNLTKPWYVHLLIKDNQIFFLSPVIMSCLGIIWVMCLYYVTQMSEKWMTPFPVLQDTKMYTFRIFSGNQIVQNSFCQPNCTKQFLTFKGFLSPASERLASDYL